MYADFCDVYAPMNENNKDNEKNSSNKLDKK